MGDEVELIAEVLRDHRLGFRDTNQVIKNAWYCTGCRWVATVVANGRDAAGVTTGDQHLAHLTDELAARVQAAHAEDAARLAEVERAFAGIRCALLHWQAEGVTQGVSCANCQSWAKSIAMPFFTARTSAALGVTAPTASEAGDERDCPTPGCQGDARYAAPGRHHTGWCRYPAPAEVSEVEGSDG